ncbi:phage major capsid protein [Pseudoxanthobacter sp. M-2]|uniref:phage major capsid family protein n=1 Tax=Pseudoxanthobacter sp. M-2 TaxID=3078754 RepID=UPI0038FCEA89
MRVVADLDNQFPKQSAYVERAVFAEVMAHAGLYHDGSDAFLQERYPTDKISRAVLNRANVDLSTTGNQAALAESALRSFLVSLAPESAAAELIRRGVRIDIGRSSLARFPFRSGAPTAAPWVGQGDPIPVVSRTFDGVTIGPAKKIALISAITRELAKRADGEAVVTRVLREDVAAGLDAAYFSTAAASDAANAGLLNGVSALSGTPGADAVAMAADLEALAAAVSENGSGAVVYIMSPKNAARLPIRVPEIAGRITVLPSHAVANTRIIAVDPVSVLHSTDPAPDIVVSRDAVLHMSDVPLEIVSDTGPTTADPVRSIYQTDGIAIRIIAEIAFAKRRSDAVAFINDASW